ncbi:hypothetical protein [Shewanella sp. YLB-07]|uniref:hypothetical protein n=1 Tax=Shewanella sp. YLB-07 TaxID=2601268 RepID=UPI00128CADB0|nr:hypothetical protein [Shewanella sp. YLB-07]MPY24510.1 hypothetical protein [Shewanella sp. YLB-07]
MLMDNTASLPAEAIALLQTAKSICPAEVAGAKQFLQLLYRSWHLGSNANDAELSSSVSTNGVLANSAPANKVPANSLLTPSGYPLEFTFRSSKSELAYTAEPGLAQSKVIEKWAFAHELESRADTQLNPLLAQLIAQPAQHFGCWLGVCHKGAKQNFKIYQEVTSAMAEPVRNQLYASLMANVSLTTNVRSGALFTPTLLGVLPADKDTTEYYGQVENPSFSVLHKLYRASGKAAILPCVLNYLAELAALPRDEVFTKLKIGLSFKITNSQVSCITLFCHASQLFSSNFQARTRWLAMVGQLSGEAQLYLQLTASLQAESLLEHDCPQLVHGLVGLGAGDGNHIECSIGLRPFSPSPKEQTAKAQGAKDV